MAAANRDLLKGRFSDGSRQVDGNVAEADADRSSVSSMWSTVGREIAAGHWA
ncbi:hypothetical protein [Streptomyces sp. NPDC093060]|uniref:hypothetical protein n=1 Tax=Streptomyces sp. NPDC093060 TaxID=3366019 RepID=UPI003801FAA9